MQTINEPTSDHSKAFYDSITYKAFGIRITSVNVKPFIFLIIYFNKHKVIAVFGLEFRCR